MSARVAANNIGEVGCFYLASYTCSNASSALSNCAGASWATQ